MKTPHLLRVEKPPEAFAELLGALAAAGLRCGWLELAEPAPPPELAAAARLGVLRAVTAGERANLSLKPRRSRPVLRDLLREHFLGCRLVLVRGEVAAPRLGGSATGWRLSFAEAPARNYATDELVAALRRPAPWPAV